MKMYYSFSVVLLSGLKYFKLNQVDFYFLLCNTHRYYNLKQCKAKTNSLYVSFVSLNFVEVSCYQTRHDHTTAWNRDGCQSRLAHTFYK